MRDCSIGKGGELGDLSVLPPTLSIPPAGYRAGAYLMAGADAEEEDFQGVVNASFNV